MTRTHWQQTRGQELVEFALTVVMLILLLMGIFDLGRVVIYYSSLQNAVREGARYGIVHEGDVTGVENRVHQMAFMLEPDVSVSIPVWDDEVMRVSATYQFTPVTPLIGRFFPPNGHIQLVASSRMWVEY